MEVVNGTQKNYPSNGINFASAGSGVLRETNKDMRVIPIQDKLQKFQTLVQQKKIDPNLIRQFLFFLESCSNDVFSYFLPSDTPTLDPDAYVQTMLTEVGRYLHTTYTLGARCIALGPVGCVLARPLLPGAPTDRCFRKVNNMVKKYNQGLESLVKGIPAKYPGAVGTYGARVYSIVQRLRAMPKRHRFTDVSNACCGDGILWRMLQFGQDVTGHVQTPVKHLFWDYFHPSEHTYALTSKASFMEWEAIYDSAHQFEVPGQLDPPVLIHPFPTGFPMYRMLNTSPSFCC